MSEELKCPCCGWVNEANLYNSFACTQCLFMCTKHDFNRIAAAMELAYRYVESSGPHAEERQTHIAMKDHHDYLKLAQDRVLEVFK